MSERDSICALEEKLRLGAITNISGQVFGGLTVIGPHREKTTPCAADSLTCIRPRRFKSRRLRRISGSHLTPKPYVRKAR